MSDNVHFYEPRRGHGLPHDPLNAIIAPRPIGWISTRSKRGVLNLAPYSFFNAFCYTPPIIGFSSNGEKDTLHNVQETGDFAWNLVTRDLAAAMNATSAVVGPEVNEFELAGLTPTPSRIISAPRVLESKVSFECRCTQIVQLLTKEGEKVKSWMVFGEVVGIHIDRALLRDGIYDTANAGHVVRGGGPGDYFIIGPEQLFHMKRPGQ